MLIPLPLTLSSRNLHSAARQTAISELAHEVRQILLAVVPFSVLQVGAVVCVSSRAVWAFVLVDPLTVSCYTADAPRSLQRASCCFQTSRPVVCIIDTGVDYLHPDLKDNILVNQRELHGRPGVDDDGNGVIDDIYGADFSGEDGDPMDDHSHGTHVAGTIGAVANNGEGVVGVIWKPHLVPCKFLDANNKVGCQLLTRTPLEENRSSLAGQEGGVC